jgi:hypothetical protein
MFHQSSKVFRPKELVNPLVELRNTDIVSPAEVHTAIMVAIVNLASWFGKKTLAILLMARLKARAFIAANFAALQASRSFGSRSLLEPTLRPRCRRYT